MKTHEFIKALRNSADKELIFANADGQSIHAGYHLTEIKAASFETLIAAAKRTVGMKPFSNCGCRKTLRILT